MTWSLQKITWQKSQERTEDNRIMHSFSKSAVESAFLELDSVLFVALIVLKHSHYLR